MPFTSLKVSLPLNLTQNDWNCAIFEVKIAVLMKAPVFSGTTQRNIVDRQKPLKQLSTSTFGALQDSS
jgi:hypothetical protein